MYVSVKYFVIQLAIFFILLQKISVNGQWVVTANVREEYENGSNGYCEYGGDENADIVCTTGWENLGLKNGILLEMSNSCRYFNMSRVYQCRDSDTAAVICTRKVLFFQMRSECFNEWLGWQDCSENPETCSLGIARRYMFTSPSSFRFQTRLCKSSTCPEWGPWFKQSESCNADCTSIWERRCYKYGRITDPQNCPGVFGGALGNLTHQILPCLEKQCIDRRLPNPFSYNIIECQPPPLTILNYTLPPPTTTAAPVKQMSSSHVFSMETFWVGFCAGMAAGFAIIVIVVFLYFKTWKGRATIAAIKTYRHNEKLYYNRKKRQDKEPTLIDIRTPQNQPRISSTFSRNSFRHDLDGKAVESSASSIRSYRKDEGYRSNPNSGSLSGYSKYQESLSQSQPPWGTYYTPVGEDKLLKRQPRPALPYVVQAKEKEYHESDSFDSDCDSVSESVYDSPRYLQDVNESVASLDIRKGAFYYEKHFESQNRKPKGEFDEDAYIRNYQAYRNDRYANYALPPTERIHRTKSPETMSVKSRSSEKRAYSRRRSDEEQMSARPSRTLDYNYSKIRKRDERKKERTLPKINRDSEPEDIRAQIETLRLNKESYRVNSKDAAATPKVKVDLNEEKWQYPQKNKKPKEEVGSTTIPQSNSTKTCAEDEAFEFPPPPEFVGSSNEIPS